MGPRVLPTTITLVHVCSLSTSFLKVRLDKFKPYTLATYRPAVVMRALGVLTAEEVQFLSEDLPIDVVSNFAYNQGGMVSMLHGDLSGFAAAFAKTVPVWIAFNLKRRGKCSVVSEKREGCERYWWRYLSHQALQRTVQCERDSVHPQMLPFRAPDVAEALCKAFREDVAEWQRIHDMLLELRTLRRQKLRTLLRSQSTLSQGLYLNNYTATELNLVRKFIAQSTMDSFD